MQRVWTAFVLLIVFFPPVLALPPTPSPPGSDTNTSSGKNASTESPTTVQPVSQQSLKKLRSDLRNTVEKKFNALQKEVGKKLSMALSKFNLLLYTLIGLFIISLVNTGLIASLYFERKSGSRRDASDKGSAGELSDSIKKYVQQCKESGMSKNEVARKLSENGWDRDQIRRALDNY